MKRRRAPKGRSPARASKQFHLRIYVAGASDKCARAVANLRHICDEHLKGQYYLEIVDLLRNPKLARGDQILAVPTLVRRLPPPIKRIIGDLSSTDRVLVGLDLKPALAGNDEAHGR